MLENVLLLILYAATHSSYVYMDVWIIFPSCVVSLFAKEKCIYDYIFAFIIASVFIVYANLESVAGHFILKR